MKLEVNYTKEKWEKHKHVETKKHAAKKPMGQLINQRGNKKNLKINENGNIIFQNL